MLVPVGLEVPPELSFYKRQSNMKKIIFFFFLSFYVLANSQAQNITINEDPNISSMMSRMVQLNWLQENVDGWRIQILATTDRIKMEDVKREFLGRYPNIPINWVHSKPYYKLQAGAFATKLEAIRLLHELKQTYPSAYPAKDQNINPRELVGL